MATRFLPLCAAALFSSVAANSQPQMPVSLSHVGEEWFAENTGQQTITGMVFRWGTQPLMPYINIGPDFTTGPMLPQTKVKLAVKPVDALEVRAVILEDGTVIGSAAVDGYDFVENIFEFRRAYAKELQLWTAKLHKEGLEKFQTEVSEASKTWEQPYDLATSAINAARSDVKNMLSWVPMATPGHESEQTMARFDKRTGEVVRSAIRRTK